MRSCCVCSCTGAALSGWRGADPRTPPIPTDPAYDWSGYDRHRARCGRRRTSAIVFTIFGTPAWANGGRPADARADASDPTSARSPTRRPSATAVRSSGLTAPCFPRVRYWTAWNEPNLPIGLMPQWKKVGGHWVIQSARDYARICNAVVGGVTGTFIPGERVACGDTAPRGNNAPTSSRPTTSPLAFLRAMKAAGAAGFDAYAHHPYPSGPYESPTMKPRGSTAVTFGNLDVLVSGGEAPLRAAAAVARRVRLPDEPARPRDSACRRPSRRAT